MGWLGSGDLNVGIWVKSDEGLPMGGAKYAKWAKKPNVGKMGKMVKK